MRTKWMRSSPGSSAWRRKLLEGVSNGSAGCTSVREIFLHPAEDRLVPQLAVQRAQDPVPLVRKNQHLAGHAIPPERGEELQPLVHGDTVIELVGDDQRRRLDALGEQVRRPLCKLRTRL